jgi:hypothetical protein
VRGPELAWFEARGNRYLCEISTMKKLIIVMAALLVAGCLPEEKKLSEESQRDQQFFQCQLNAMQRHQPEGDYTRICMGAAGWRIDEPNKDWKNSYMYPFCWVRMK